MAIAKISATGRPSSTNDLVTLVCAIHSRGSSERPHLNGKPTSVLASIKYNDIDDASQVSSSSAISAFEAEEKTLRETLMVLRSNYSSSRSKSPTLTSGGSSMKLAAWRRTSRISARRSITFRGNWDSLISPVHIARSHQACSRQVKQETFDSSLSTVSQSRIFWNEIMGI